MPERRNLCLLVAEITGADRLSDRTAATEAAHALERCMHRIDRAAASQEGAVLERNGSAVAMSFERCDSGVLAACEILDRILGLPPLSGAQLSVRLGLHYGVAEQEEGGLDVARRLAGLCRPGQALASGAAVMLLTPSTRHFAGTEAVHDPLLDTLEWPVFTIGHRVGMVTSVPPTARVSQRLRLRHQQEVVFVEEQRPVLLLGRELGNDLVIIDPRASRQHARIERRREGFILIDQSTNGTYVSMDGAAEHCVKHAELTLIGPGRIGCGFSANEVERDLVFFDIV
ncbi:FHA domain-containing protein [Azoarcus indigens]|uniref:FHA domain-containing protein n=1 Tax=Azoarcus indigens TaxID=29545 RepID=A0A4R6DS77_9RHOO|nr:FHA domain-containing protein [Azoarcus indigens]NMG66462.1 FHA domain-containing protein [Azoarcus indigens]TDN47369.1 FHA domain-containing protein [Azoarcus indigens]